jgi:uncharacterized membrane protein
MDAPTLFRFLLAATMTFAGIMHFISPRAYLKMMPRALPFPGALVAISGVFEILGGVGLLIPSTQRWAAWGLIALLIAVFPANVNMAIHRIPLGKKALPTWALWARLPLQGVVIAWAHWFT